MTVAPEALTLFDVTDDGVFVMHDQEPVLAEVPDPAGMAKEAWLEGRTDHVHPMDLAVAVTLPDDIRLQTRAYHLTEALRAMGRANADLSYGKASRSAVYRHKIEADAGPHADDKADELAARSLAGMGLARYRFFAANGIGHLAMRTGEEMTPTEHLARVSVERQWGDFQTAFGGVGKVVRERRAAFRAKLAKQMAYTTAE